METENKALIRRWFEEVWNQGRQELIDQLRAPDAGMVGLGEGSTRSEGPAPFKIFYSRMRSALPDMRVEVEDILAEGDRVAVRLSILGTHTGNGFNSIPTGRKVQFTCITIARIADGRIAEAWNNLDQLGLLTQIGVIPQSAVNDRFLGKAR